MEGEGREKEMRKKWGKREREREGEMKEVKSRRRAEGGWVGWREGRRERGIEWVKVMRNGSR